MYSTLPTFVLGFHGCDIETRDKIISGKTTLKPSENSYDWLGNGIYFWENYREHSLRKVFGTLRMRHLNFLSYTAH